MTFSLWLMVSWKRLQAQIGRRMPGTIRGRLLLLLLVVLLPILLLQAGIYYNRFQESRSAELQTNLEVARAVAVTFDEYLQDVLHQELAIGLAFTSPTPLSPEQKNQFLAQNVQEYTTVGDFQWIDPRGLILDSSQPKQIGSSIRDRPYFQAIVDGREWAVGDLVLEPGSGEPSFAIGRGIRDSHGVLQGLVLAIVDSPHLGRVFQMERARQGTFVIFDKLGQIVYQRPEVALSWQDRNPTIDAMVRSGLVDQEVTGTFSTADGQGWMGAVTPIPSIGWVTRAGRPEAEINTEIFRDLSRDLMLIFVVALGALLVALLVSTGITGPVKRVREYAASVGRGDEVAPPPATLGPREMNELSATLNSMAEEIRVRERLLRMQVAALDRSNAALRDAEQRLLTEREQERKALARELHDQVIQDLISVRFELEGLAAEGFHNGDLTEVHDSVGTLIDDVRDICTNLRPPTIDSLGVGPAVQSYIEDWSARTGIASQVELDPNLGRLPEMVELSIFRIVQEGLSNLWKHASATLASIRLKRASTDMILVEISDNGRGTAGDLDLAALAESGHYGLVGIGERVTLLGGRLKVQSRTTDGFLLQVEIPAVEVGSDQPQRETRQPVDR